MAVPAGAARTARRFCRVTHSAMTGARVPVCDPTVAVRVGADAEARTNRLAGLMRLGVDECGPGSPRSAWPALTYGSRSPSPISGRASPMNSPLTDHVPGL
jgi:hypothetical protein